MGERAAGVSGPVCHPPVDLFGRPTRAEKHFFHGTHRTAAPEETLERIRPILRSAGITRLADVTGLDRIPISTVLAIRPNSKTLASGSGKGFTKVSATVSAAMEAIEYYSAEQGDLDWVTATWNELAATDDVVAAEDLQLTKYSLFSVDLAERWVAGWDIVSSREIFVPLLSVSMTPDGRTGPFEVMSFQVGSNGLASGNVLLEAVAAGLYEAIERDAVTRWEVATEATGIACPRVRLESVEHPLPRELIDRLSSAGVGVVVEDCTTDTSVPVYRALIHDRSADFGFFVGCGAHLDSEIAMVRAITEAVQSRVIYVAGSRDDVFDHARHLMKRREHERVHEDFERGDGVPDTRSLRSEATGSFEGDIAVMIDRLHAAGLHQVIVVDLTRPELEVPVAKIVVPGLEGYRFRFYTPGRRASGFVRELAERAGERARAARS